MKDKLNYLSIASNPYRISYSIFKGKKLTNYGHRSLEYKLDGSVLLDIQNHIKDLLEAFKIDIVLMKDIELEDYVKKDLEKMIEYQTTIHLTSLNNGVLFSRFRTYGWEKRLSYTNNLTNAEKIRIVNYGYGLELERDKVDIADSIILGEAVAHNRLHIGR